MKIRRATTGDAHAAATVMQRSIRELCFEDHRGDRRVLDDWLRNKTPESVMHWIASNDDYCVVATDARDAVVGFGMITRAGEILLLYVDPDAIGQGAGHALLDALEQRARTWQLEAIVLDSTRSSRAFYERYGYAGRDAGSERADGLSCEAMEKPLAID